MKIHRCRLLNGESDNKRRKYSECTEECVFLSSLLRRVRKRNIRSEAKGIEGKPYANGEQEIDNDEKHGNERNEESIGKHNKNIDQECTNKPDRTRISKSGHTKLLNKLLQQSKTSRILHILKQIDIKMADDQATRNLLLHNLNVLIHHSSLRVRQRVSILFKKLCKFVRLADEHGDEEQSSNAQTRTQSVHKPFNLLRLFKKNNNVTDGALIFALEDTDPYVRKNALKAILQLSHIHKLSSLAFSFYLDMLFDPDTAISTLSARCVYRLTKMYDITVSEHNLEHLFVVVPRCNERMKRYVVKTVGNLMFDEHTVDGLVAYMCGLDKKYLIYCAERIVENNQELIERMVEIWRGDKTRIRNGGGVSDDCMGKEGVSSALNDASSDAKNDENSTFKEYTTKGAENYRESAMSNEHRYITNKTEKNHKHESAAVIERNVTVNKTKHNEVIWAHEGRCEMGMSQCRNINSEMEQNDKMNGNTIGDLLQIPNIASNDPAVDQHSLSSTKSDFVHSLFAFFLKPTNDYLQLFVHLNKHKSKNVKKRERTFALDRLGVFLKGNTSNCKNYFRTCKNYIRSDTHRDDSRIVKDDSAFFTFIYDVYTAKKHGVYLPLLLTYNLASLGILTFSHLLSFISRYHNVKGIRSIKNVFNVPSTVRVNDVLLISFTVMYEGRASEHLFVRVEYKSVIFLKCTRSVCVRMRYEGRGGIKVGLVVRVGTNYHGIGENRRISVVTGE